MGSYRRKNKNSLESHNLEINCRSSLVNFLLPFCIFLCIFVTFLKKERETIKWTCIAYVHPDPPPCFQKSFYSCLCFIFTDAL